MVWSRIYKILAFFTCSPVHEIGHLIIANVDGAEILDWSIIPQIRGGYLMMAYVNVNQLSFSSLHTLILFKLAGLLITLVPSLILWQYYCNKNSNLWHIPFIWVMFSPALASHDFIDIGYIILNPLLGNILSMLASLSSVLMTLWYLKPIIERVFFFKKINFFFF